MEAKPTQHTIDTPYPVGPVHCYTLERDGELVLFDTGPPTPVAKKYFRTHVDLGRLRHIFVTHCHIDHYGLAHWFEQETGATIYLPYRDALKMRSHEQRMRMMYDLLVELGFTPEYLRELRSIFDSRAVFPPAPRNYLICEDSLPDHLGMELINCPGHSQSDVVYSWDNYIVSGDTLLRGIFQSPLLDVDLISGERFNNYDAYCGSVVQLAGLNGKIVLPGHRKSVESVNDILLFYIDKLLVRAKLLLPYRSETNVSNIVRTIFKNSITDVFHIYLKASEILFMQDFLAAPEKLENALRATGLFHQVADAFHRVTGR